GGTGPYTYEWSNNSTSKDQFNLTSDQYTVIIRDANNCTLIQSIDLGGNRGLDIDVNTTNVSCKGDSNGAISIDVSGGSGNFSFQWDNGNTTNSLDNLLAGVYRCVVTDGEGCDNSIIVVISEPSRNLEASLDYSARLSCFSGQDGYAVANPIGGTAPYNYMWSNFETDQRIEGLSSGNYSVIITDANNCTYQQNFEITEPEEQLVIQIEGKLELDCVGDSDGFIKIKLTGGEGPYEIRWSNGSPSNQLSDLRAGNYSVQVRDNAGCLLQQTISISQSEAIQITKVEINDTDCYGDRSGSINIDVAGGKKPYTFLWSNGTNQKNLSGVTTGNYNVIITDANNCTYQQTFNLNNATRFELNPQISPISCRGAEDSSISLNIQGGTGPYSIVWNTGETDEIIRDLGPGVYEARVVDSNGCDITQTFNITDPSLITSTAIINDPLDCSDPTSGSIFLTTSGGRPPYSYEWTNGVTTSSIANISEGNYGVIIRDQFGCSITKTFSVTRPEEINIVLQSELIIDCESQNVTALVKAEVIGGLSDYAFAWNKSPGAESIAEISQSGRVVLNVTDRRGCQKIVEINLDFPEFSNADFIFNSASLDRDQLLSVFDSIYFKDLSGDAAVEWNWDFGDDFTSDLQNPSHSYVAPGDYQVSLFTTDEAGCQTSRSMILTLEVGYRVIIPSAFTPDGDGLNDFFQAKFIGLQSYRLSIFSKSGEIIFSTNEIDSRGWDGLIGGQVAMNGQYVYRFTGLSYTGIDIDRTGTFSSVN
ncbi:MAG: gliding motility-associated-like protein, partial [Cyclobacteriaceae bacterium]